MEVQLVKEYEGLRMDQVITFEKIKIKCRRYISTKLHLEDAEIVE